MDQTSDINLKSGHFNLFSILEFVANHPIMPTPGASDSSGFKPLIDQVIQNVPVKPGWYLWGKFNDMGWWETIYLGKAGCQKTSSLHTRLYDEIRKEFIAFWAYIYGREPMTKQYHKIYNNKYDPTRSLRKTGSQFVIWVEVNSTISEEKISRQEEILINYFRPTHNSARWGTNLEKDVITDRIESVIEKELKNIQLGITN